MSAEPLGRGTLHIERAAFHLVSGSIGRPGLTGCDARRPGAKRWMGSPGKRRIGYTNRHITLDVQDTDFNSELSMEIVRSKASVAEGAGSQHGGSMARV
jgi:hypothetical protein